MHGIHHKSASECLIESADSQRFLHDKANTEAEARTIVILEIQHRRGDDYGKEE